MVRYRYTGSELLYTAQTTGGAVVDIPNNGVTVITSTAAERYVLAPPVAGCQKRLVFLVSTSSLSRLIELSSLSSGDSVTLTHTTGSNTATEISFESTVAGFVDLLGLSSNSWLLVNAGFGQVPSTALVLTAS